MITIKNAKELKKLVDKNKNLIIDEDVRIEFSPTREQLRDVKCRDLFMMNNNERFDFNGRDFNGWNFTGRDFNGGDFNGGNFNGRDFNGVDFNGRDFNGGNFNGRDFNGWNFHGVDFTGKNVSYHAFFCAYGNIKCTAIKGRRKPCAKPICLDGKLEIVDGGK